MLPAWIRGSEAGETPRAAPGGGRQITATRTWDVTEGLRDVTGAPQPPGGWQKWREVAQILPEHRRKAVELEKLTAHSRC